MLLNMNPTYQTYPAQILTAIFQLLLNIVAILAISIFTIASTHIFKASETLYLHSCSCTTETEERLGVGKRAYTSKESCFAA